MIVFTFEVTFFNENAVFLQILPHIPFPLEPKSGADHIPYRIEPKKNAVSKA